MLHGAFWLPQPAPTLPHQSGVNIQASAKPTAIGALPAFSTRKARGRPKLFVLTSPGSNLLLDVFRRFEHEVWPPEAFRADFSVTKSWTARSRPERFGHFFSRFA
jgi:hypothetical protein